MIVDHLDRDDLGRGLVLDRIHCHGFDPVPCPVLYLCPDNYPICRHLQIIPMNTRAPLKFSFLFSPSFSVVTSLNANRKCTCTVLLKNPFSGQPKKKLCSQKNTQQQHSTSKQETTEIRYFRREQKKTSYLNRSHRPTELILTDTSSNLSGTFQSANELVRPYELVWCATGHIIADDCYLPYGHW